jgi:hypothetical protein
MSVLIGLLYVKIALGDKDDAFSWLEQSYLARSGNLTFLKMDPMLDPLEPPP